MEQDVQLPGRRGALFPRVQQTVRDSSVLIIDKDFHGRQIRWQVRVSHVFEDERDIDLRGGRDALLVEEGLERRDFLELVEFAEMVVLVALVIVGETLLDLLGLLSRVELLPVD